MRAWRAKLLLAGALVLLWTTAYGEFYQYTDTNGVLRFTDDLASVPPEQRPDVKTHQSVKSDPVQPAAAAPVTGNQSPGAAPSIDGTPPQTGAWNAKIASQANELDRMQVELNKAYRDLQAAREALEAKTPPAGASTEARDAYRKQVKNLNARIENYEAQYAAFREKEKAFNDQYRK